MRGKGIRNKSCCIEPIDIAGALTAKHCGDSTSDCSNGVLIYPAKVVKPYGSTGGIGGVKLKENEKDIASPITARDYKGILRNDGDAIVEVRTDGSSPKHNNRVIVGGLPIREATNKGYSVAYPGDGVNIGMPSSTTRRGRVNHGLANTLTTTSEMGVVNHDIRIRRLTPRECWRLQGFPDEYFDKAKAAGISDSQLYKMAGNAVTVNVARAIGEKLREIEDEETENEFSY